ncbi:MAG: alpha-ketoglutarate-dependent dioxygenase AlkB [Salegentibacter sp.]
MPEALKPQIIQLPNAELLYFNDFLEKSVADFYFKKLLTETPWGQDKIKLFGKEHLQPRLTALYASNEKPYSYSGISMNPEGFSEELLTIKKQVEKVCHMEFTTCLMNLYRDGRDSMGWHSDDEKELGKNPVIASVSLGAERLFKLKHKEDKIQKFDITPAHGSLLVMKGKTQQFWKHQVPKTKKEKGQRINLTFRRIV